MSIFIIGDIHGCSLALGALLEKLRSDPAADSLIFLGDLFDRGPDSWGVWQAVRVLAGQYGERLTLLRGNHEDYLLSKHLSIRERMTWDRVGRGATVRSFREHGQKMEDAVPWLQEHCRLYTRLGEIQCVHAGLLVDPLEANDTFTLVHDHMAAFMNRYAGPLTVTGHIALPEPTWFPGSGEPTEHLPRGTWLDLPDRGIICIDTGCGKGGELTAMTVEGGRFLLTSVPERAV